MKRSRTERAREESRSFGVRRIPLLRPLGWLARGWRDLRRCPGPGLCHGLAVTAFGALLIWLASDRFWLLVGAFTGFLIVAPVLATGLYAVSQSLERGGRPTWRTAAAAWRPRDGRLIVFGLLLAFAGTGWVMTSASLITGWTGGRVDTPRDFLLLVVLAPTGAVFETWLAMGALLAAPVFASSVVAIPLLLDKPVGVLGAVLTSWRVVLEHPAPMALWAALLLGLTMLGMLGLMLALPIVMPWLAHASWHAYRDLVEPSPAGEVSR
jgi:uncharacterized membrane protein